ncbi:FtsX-like permease family protein [Luteococcus sp. H138]|uniref:FtsX-like permease family protein n=1 Tax=unclassified Luteococcus TaxID=2639923 RepID=UPI00313C4C15
MFNSLALRLARRDLATHKGRSLLICLLIALPMAVMGFVSVLAASSDATGAEQEAQQFGQAVAEVTSADGVQPVMKEQPKLTAEQRGIPSTVRQVKLVVDGVPHVEQIVATDLADPAQRGRVVGDLSGDRAGIWVSSLLAKRYQLHSGGRVAVNGKEYQISGVLRRPYGGVFVFPGHPLAGRDLQSVLVVGKAPTTDQQRDWLAQGLGYSLPGENSAAADSALVGLAGAWAPILLTGALIISVIASTMAAAAFSIGVAQQRRSLSLISITGAPGAVLQRIVAAQGLVLGVPSALLGVGLGAGVGALLVRQWLARGVDYFAGVHIPWVLLPLIALIGATAAVLAAWLPACKLAHQDVLAGVRSESESAVPARFSRAGAALVLAALLAVVLGSRFANLSAEPYARGLHVENYVIAGMIACALVFFGLLLNAGWLLSLLGKLSKHGPLPWRLALRDGSRHRARAVSTVAAAMAAATLLSAAMAAFSSLGAERLANVQPERPGWGMLSLVDVDSKPVSPQTVSAAVAVIGKHLGPVAQQVTLGKPDASNISLDFECTSGSCSYPSILVATAPQAVALLGEVVDDAALKTLASGGAIATRPEAVRGGRASFSLIKGDDLQPVAIPAVVVDGSADVVLVSEATGKKLQLGDPTPTLLFRVGAAPSVDQVSAASTDLASLGLSSDPQIETVPTDGYSLVNHYLLPVGLGLLLVIALITTALGLKDVRASHETMAAVGASSVTIRTMAAAQAWVANGLGILLGMVTGLLPMAAVIGASGGRFPFAAPWGYLAVVLLLAPLLATGLAWLLTRPPAPRAVRID